MIYKTSSFNGSYHAKVLDYETMESVSLCNKPNCSHQSTDCIIKRLGYNLPVFDDWLFGEGKVFDLNTLAVTEPDALKDANVLAQYGDSYICSYFDHDEQIDIYKKISAAEIFGDDAA